MFSIFGFDVETGTLLIGALTGLAYGLLGVGLVLIYRATRVINFAHGEIGAFCAVVFAKLVLDVGLPYPVAFVAVAALGAVVAALWERLVVRRLHATSRLVLLVATIGIAQTMLAAQLFLPDIDNPGRYPSLFEADLHLFDTVFGGGHITVVIVVPLLAAALAWFLNRTFFGVAIRASADNTDSARLAGIEVHRISTAVWAISGALAAITFVLVNPVRGEIAGSTAAAALGPGLLMRALVAALAGGLTSLPRALAGGVALGAVEALLFVNIGRPGTVDLYIFLAVLVLVFLKGRSVVPESSNWSLAPRIRPIPAALREITWVRRLPLTTTGVALVIAVLAPLVLDRPSQQFTLARTIVFALAGLSVVVITGWAGQLSLAQFALVGVGAVTTAGLVDRGVPFGWAVVYATVAGVVGAVAVGAPALRVRGPFLAVTTLAFAIAARGWLLPHPVFFKDSTTGFVERSRWWFIDLGSQRTYYYVSLTIFVLVALSVSRLRQSGVGRRVIAVRENEPVAAAVTVSPARAKLGAFGLSGGIAALAGGLLAGLEVQFGAASFGPEASLQLVSMVIIGGVGSVAGAVFGAIYLVAVPALTGTWVRDLLGGSETFVLLLGGVGLVTLLLQNPGGMVQGLYAGRDALLRMAERRRRQTAAAAGESAEAAIVATDGPAAPTPVPVRRALPTRSRRREEEDAEGDGDGDRARPALLTDQVTVAYGGLVANRSVSIHVEPGEIVGLIGTNGAGKSTLMQAISGFAPVASGRIEVLGHDVTDLLPHERAALGVGRVFQDARLFPDLTVRETIAVAVEARHRTEVVPAMLALPPARKIERRIRAEASELIDFLGLGRYADAFVAELSTGTRRFVELACVLAVDARLILLDEPTAGVAQRETEAFGPLIRDIQRSLAATVVIIEHDMPLVMSLSDRVYCLSAGEVIAEGTPTEMRTDPNVIAAYLGTDARAIERSDAVGAEAGRRGGRR